VTKDDYFSSNTCGFNKINSLAGNYRAFKGELSCPNPWIEDVENSSFGK